MRIIALMPARNEDWIIGLSLRAALMWCDEVVVLDHASTDRTFEIVEEIRKETGRVTVLRSDSEGWHEMKHRQMLLEAGRDRGATHFSIVDADEVLTGNQLGLIRAQVEQLPPGGMLQLPMRNTYGAIDRYRRDGSIWGTAITTIAFADRPGLHWAASDGYHHHHREPYGARVSFRAYPNAFDGGVMHLQFASRRRLLAKHAWYQMHERLSYPSKPVGQIAQLYSMAPNWDGATILPAPPDWWEPYRHLLPLLKVDAEPWQEQQCRRFVEQHGRELFAGLNLFGVV
jgi:hypothetical protein